MLFYVGLDDVYTAHHFERCCISVNRLRTRKADIAPREWMLDSGAFTEISTHGHYRQPVAEYVRQIERWARCGALHAAVSQDYMCEPWILDKTGLSIADHQRLTIERYDALRTDVQSSIHIMPVLQGYAPSDYVGHIRQYGPRLTPGMWVGVGSVCKRNANVAAIEAVLLAISAERPDLRLHGFGVKLTALKSSLVRRRLHSADSMAWSFAARRTGQNAHDWRNAAAFVERIEGQRIIERSFQHSFVEGL